MATKFAASADVMLDRARWNIADSIDFSSTPQGQLYWDEVFMYLTQLVNEYNLQMRNGVVANGVRVKVIPKSVDPSTEQAIHVTDGMVGLCDKIRGKPWEWPVGHTHVPLDAFINSNCPECVNEAKKRMAARNTPRPLTK